MEWRDIPGFEGHYKVSECGDVLSCARVISSRRHQSGTKRLRERILKQQDREGYPSVALHLDGETLRLDVHRLVARAFHGPCPEGQETRHRDGNRSNPHRDNLVYGTRAENVADAIEHGTFTRGENNGAAKLTNARVATIKRQILDGARTTALAREHGVSPQAICDIKHERNWAHVYPAGTF